MPLDIDTHIKRVLEEKDGDGNGNRRLAEHLRLLGFHEIIDNSNLGMYKIEDYTQKIEKNFKPFTKLTSSSFLLANEELVKKQKLFSVHLPIDDSFHILFFLEAQNAYIHNIIYDSCPYCEQLAPYKFPLVELRRSVGLEMGSCGCIMYDNTVSIREQDEALLKKQYTSFEDFIKNTKLG